MYVSHCCVFGLPADDVRFTLLCYGVFRGRCVFCIAAGGFFVADDVRFALLCFGPLAGDGPREALL